MPDGAAGPLLVAQHLNHRELRNSQSLPGPGGVTAGTDKGLWGTGADGRLRLLLREGDKFDGKRVRSFTVLSAVLGAPGVTRSFNSGEVALRVVFTDFTEGIVRIQVPNAPEEH